MKEEALKLADVGTPDSELAIHKIMIRRLVEELDKQTYKADLLENRLKVLVGTKPLSDEEIYDLWCDADNTEYLPEMRMKDGSINYVLTTFVQLIEERHGIK